MISVVRSTRWPATARWYPVVLGCAAACGALVALAGPSAAVLLVAGALAGYMTAFMPGVVLAAYFLIPFYKGVLQPLSPVDLTVVLAVLNAAQLVPVVFDRRRLDVPNAGVVLWIALATLIGGGVLHAPDQRLALDTLVNWMLLVFVPLLAGSLRVAHDPRFLRQFIWVLFATSAFAVVAGLALMTATQRLVVPGMDTIGMGRAALLLPLLAVTYVLGESPVIVRAATVLLVPAAVLVAVASGSRGPLVVGAVMGVVWIVHSVVSRRFLTWRRVGAVALVAVVVLVVLSSVGAALPEVAVVRFASFGDFVRDILSGESGASPSDVTSGQRVRLFELAVSLFQANPVIGVGTAGYEALGPGLIGPAAASAYPHNAVLQFAADFGLVGVVLFAAVALWALGRPLPAGPAWRSAWVLLVFFLLNAMVSGAIYTDRQLWLLVVVILVAAWPRAAEQAGTLDPARIATAPAQRPGMLDERGASRPGTERRPEASTFVRRAEGATGRPTAP